MSTQPLMDFGNWTPASPRRLCACGKPARANRPKCNKCSRGRQKPKPCAFCGTLFTGHHDKRYCSPECLKADWVRIHPEVEEFRALQAHPRIVVRTFHAKCKECGIQIVSSSIREHCGGRKCKNLYAYRWQHEDAGIKYETVECVLCGSSFKQDRIGRNHCENCRTTDRIRRVWHEDVNVRAKLEADGWKCKHCGKSTPESERGTLEQTAPELDHILPLSLGGAHSWANMQCLCRACNTEKRDDISKEPRLQGVTDYAPYKQAMYPPTAGDQPETLCACGCGETFTPSHSNITGCKHGHWYRTPAGQRKAERERLNSWAYRKQTLEKTVEQDDPLIEQALLIMEAQEAKANPKQPIEAPPQAASAPALGRLSVREYVRRGVWQRA